MQLKKPKVFLHKGQFPNRLELSFVILSGQLANEEILHRSILGNTSIVLSVLSKVYVLLRLIFLELSSRLLKWAITFWRLAQWRISEHKTVNTPQMLMRCRMFN